MPGIVEVMPLFLLATSPGGIGGKGVKVECKALLGMAMQWAEYQAKQIFPLTWAGCS